MKMLFEELEEINENLVYLGEEPAKYKDAIVGLSHDNNHVIYSYNKLVECFQKIDGMSEEEAIDWIECNTIRAIPYMGEYAPILMYDLEG